MIPLLGLLERVGVHGDHGVELVLVQRDPGEVLEDQLPRAQAALLHRGAHLGDGLLDDAERRRGFAPGGTRILGRGGAGRRGHQQDDRQQR